MLNTISFPPTTCRELAYVSDYQNFLDFCRLEIFPNVRPKERPGTEGRRESTYHIPIACFILVVGCKGRRFYPEYYKQVSEVFQQHLQNLREREKSEADTGHRKEGVELYSWDNFVPRRIPLSALLHDPDHAPWRKYLATPMTSDDPLVDFKCLPNSVVLLLELCSDVVDTPPLTLMQQVRNVEWQVIQGPLSSLIPTYADD